jgi:protein TonB
MKKIIIFQFVFFAVNFSFAQRGTIKVDKAEKQQPKIDTSATTGYSTSFMLVQLIPQYPGGYSELIKFIKSNLVYPKSAAEAGISGTVYVSFVVEKDGSISNVRIQKGIFPDCDKEAIRVVSLMPKWTPGKENGKIVSMRCSLPIKFKIENK